MVLGIVGLLLGLIPCVGWIGLPLSGLGLLLGVAGGVVAVLRGGRGVGFPIAGSGISGLALVIGGFWLFLIAKVAKAVDDGNKASSAASRAADQDGASWASPDEAVTHGDLQIRIVRVTTGQVPVKDIIREDAASKHDLLMVELNLVNPNPTKKVEYHSWAGKDISFNRDYATLNDNFGNSYRRVGFGLGAHPVGAVEDWTTIYPHQPVSELLVFQLPLASATYLDLELPAESYGGEGVIRFRIPIEYVDKEKHDEANQRQAEKERKEREERAAKERQEREERAARERAEKERKERAERALADAKARLPNLRTGLEAAEKEEAELRETVSRLQGSSDDAAKKAAADERAYFESKRRYDDARTEGDRLDASLALNSAT
jgi:hypothetical protein